MLIQNYGLFWKTEDVFWGKPGTSGSLLGISATSKKYSIDFREQTGIYVLYADYKIIYIGQAGNGHKKLFARLKDHYQTDDLTGRWNQFSWYGLRRVLKSGEFALDNIALHPKTEVVLNHIEAILIHSAEPPLNRQGGRWGNGVQKYLQFRDEMNLGKTNNELIKEIHINLNKSLS